MKGKPTRRSFLGHAGAAIAVPLATTGALAAEDRSGSDLAARLAALEDANTIRGLLPALLAEPARMTLDASVRKLAADRDDSIIVAADGTATARLTCTVETAAPIEPCGTLVEMARLQGDGVVVQRARRVLVSAFVKRDGAWEFASAKLEAGA